MMSSCPAADEHHAGRVGGDLSPITSPSTPARMRMLAVFGAISGGVWFAIALPGLGSTALFAASLVSVSIAMMRSGWFTRLGLLGAIVLVSAGYTSERLATPAIESFGGALDPLRAQIVELEGQVAGEVRVREPDENSLRRFLRFSEDAGSWFPLDVRSAGDRSAAGRLWVSAPAGAQALLAPGDTIRLTARVTGVKQESNPMPLALDRSLRARESGVIGQARVSDLSLIGQVPPSRAIDRLTKGWHQLRSALRERARRVLGLGEDPDAKRALLSALVLGDRSSATDPVSEVFRRTGVLHLLSISGFHVAVMAGAALLVVRATGERGWLEPVLVALLILAYLLIVPVRAPIVRAGSMALALLAARALGRRHDPIAVLSWVAIGVLVWKPIELVSLGFQLSFGLVAVLILWSEKRQQEASLVIDSGGSVWRWVWEHVRGFWGACVVCWFVASPVILLHAGPLSPYGVLASLLATPVAVVLLWGAFVALLAGMVVPGLVTWVTPVLDLIAGVMWSAVSWVESLPGSSWSLPPVGLLWSMFAVACAVAIVLKGRWRSAWAWGLSLLVIGLLFSGWTLGRDGPRLRIDMLDVGDGSCFVLRSGPEAVLWDAGSLTPNPKRVERSLKALGVRRLDAVIVTHANIDHFALLPELASAFEIDRVLAGPWVIESRAQAATALRDRLAEGEIVLEPIEAGFEMTFGEASLRVISPSDPSSLSSENDRSLVALVEASTALGTARGLLTGDVQREGIAALMDGAIGPVDLMELPHHGSFLPISAALVERADPRVVLQSTGPSRLDNPQWDASKRGRTWLTTARHGWSWVEIVSDGAIVAGSRLGEH